MATQKRWSLLFGDYSPCHIRDIPLIRGTKSLPDEGGGANAPVGVYLPKERNNTSCYSRGKRNDQICLLGHLIHFIDRLIDPSKREKIYKRK